MTWRELVRLPEADMSRLDIALVNLICADGLPDATKINRRYCLETIDRWAEIVRDYTDRHLYAYWRDPARYENSEAKFRVLLMVTVLQRDLGVRYNPAKIPDEARFETEDSFLHGLIQGDGGTCASMPILYAAVGRRLGYPIKFATTYRHKFNRWEDSQEQFNIEASCVGLSIPPDEHFRTGRYEPMKEFEVEARSLLTQSPREEVADCMVQRAYRFLEDKDYTRALESYLWGLELAPENIYYGMACNLFMHHWKQELAPRIPKCTPKLVLGFHGRRFKEVPWEMEQQYLTLAVTEATLNDPENASWWEEARRYPGFRPLGMPGTIEVIITA